jgi:hypothetical protein
VIIENQEFGKGRFYECYAHYPQNYNETICNDLSFAKEAAISVNMLFASLFYS